MLFIALWLFSPINSDLIIINHKLNLYSKTFLCRKILVFDKRSEIWLITLLWQIYNVDYLRNCLERNAILRVCYLCNVWLLWREFPWECNRLGMSSFLPQSKDESESINACSNTHHCHASIPTINWQTGKIVLSFKAGLEPLCTTGLRKECVEIKFSFVTSTQ